MPFSPISGFAENCTQCIHKMKELYALHSESGHCETPRLLVRTDTPPILEPLMLEL